MENRNYLPVIFILLIYNLIRWKYNKVFPLKIKEHLDKSSTFISITNFLLKTIDSLLTPSIIRKGFFSSVQCSKCGKYLKANSFNSEVFKKNDTINTTKHDIHYVREGYYGQRKRIEHSYKTPVNVKIYIRRYICKSCGALTNHEYVSHA